MSIVVRLFWVFLISLGVIGLLAIGLIGIPPKPVSVIKPVSTDRFPQ